MQKACVRYSNMMRVYEGCRFHKRETFSTLLTWKGGNGTNGEETSAGSKHKARSNLHITGKSHVCRQIWYDNRTSCVCCTFTQGFSARWDSEFETLTP